MYACFSIVEIFYNGRTDNHPTLLIKCTTCLPEDMFGPSQGVTYRHIKLSVEKEFWRWQRNYHFHPVRYRRLTLYFWILGSHAFPRLSNVCQSGCPWFDAIISPGLTLETLCSISYSLPIRELGAPARTKSLVHLPVLPLTLHRAVIDQFTVPTLHQ
jgi:hypothetical protein